MSLKFRKAFRFEGDVEEWIASQMIGYTLNAPCGQSPLGILRLDNDPAMNPTQLYEIPKIPFACESFDTVLSDPPWKLPYFERQQQFFELCHVVKTHGRIIFNAPWVPTAKCVELETVFVRPGKTPWANTSVVSLFRKTKSCAYADAGRPK